MAKAGDVFKPGDEVPHSGIYRVVHDRNHTGEHEVTCVYDKKFPPCNHCGDHPRFVLLRMAQHIESNEHFKVRSLSEASRAVRY
jgi:hypothetical protein